MKNENINDNNINPIVMGNLRNLKLIYINEADIEILIIKSIHHKIVN